MMKASFSYFTMLSQLNGSKWISLHSPITGLEVTETIKINAFTNKQDKNILRYQLLFTKFQ
jgi:hypothetical protein